MLMKTKINLILLLLLLVLSAGMAAQSLINVPYDYPVKPGSEQWAAFTSGQQMVDACQIPSDILSKLSTKALAETCLNYPLYFEYTAYNSERDGINKVISGFNGLQELAKRPDGASALLGLYEKVSVVPNSLLKKSSEDQDLLRVGYLELLLSNNLFFEGLTNKDLVKLKQAVINKYETKVNAKGTYSMFSIQKSLLLGAKIIQKTDTLSRSSLRQATISRFFDLYERSDPQLFTDISRILCE